MSGVTIRARPSAIGAFAAGGGAFCGPPAVGAADAGVSILRIAVTFRLSTGIAPVRSRRSEPVRVQAVDRLPVMVASSIAAKSAFVYFIIYLPFVGCGETQTRAGRYSNTQLY